MSILFINACVRKDSRTLEIARYLLNTLEGEITEVDLEKENMEPLKRNSLEKRDRLSRSGKFDDEIFRYARDFAAADRIVIAAPYWDLAFPALLKIYMEAITVAGVTFRYDQGIPVGMCKAKQLIYVTTAGGSVFKDFGYAYIKFLAETFYGISETICFKTENLDVEGADVAVLLAQTKKEMDEWSTEYKTC